MNVSIALEGEGEGEGCLQLFQRGERGGYAVSCGRGAGKVVLSPSRVTAGDTSSLELCVQVSSESTRRVRAIHSIEYNQFLEALNLSREVVNMEQDLNMCLRDVFFDGMLTANSSSLDSKSVKEVGSVLANVSKTVMEKFSDISNTKVPPVPSPKKPIASTQRNVTKKNSSSKASVSTRLNYAELNCVYCDIPGNVEEMKLMVHPYVPVTMDRRVLYICNVCHSNWLYYRQQAAKENLLVLAGEYNEEVCCVCSDSPPELILCSSCPRSYCTPCLNKLLTPKQSADMSASENWLCLCCVHSDDVFRSFTRSLKLAISSQRCPLPLESSISLPSAQMQSKSESALTESSKVSNNADNDLSQRKRKRRSPIKYDDYTFEGDTKPKKGSDRQTDASRDKSREKGFSSNCKDKKRSLVGKKINALDNDVKLPPVNSDLDEVYYFSQYVHTRKNDDTIDERAKGDSTEDFCFLCKDGGDLIECDYGTVGKSKNKCTQRCVKVYHEYCLGYAIPEDVKIWFCIRHYCSLCESDDTSYQCQYCPLSCCNSCFLAWNERYKFTHFADLSTESSLECDVNEDVIARRRRSRSTKKNTINTGRITPIVCGSCLVLFERCFERGLLVKENCDMGMLRLASDALAAPYSPETLVSSVMCPPPPTCATSDKVDQSYLCCDSRTLKISTLDNDVVDASILPSPSIKSEKEFDSIVNYNPTVEM